MQCDLDVFTALNDSILDLIAISDIADPHMVEAQTLIRILKERQFRVHHDAESDKILVEVMYFCISGAFRMFFIYYVYAIVYNWPYRAKTNEKSTFAIGIGVNAQPPDSVRCRR